MNFFSAAFSIGAEHVLRWFVGEMEAGAPLVVVLL